jgi:ferredoxin
MGKGAAAPLCLNTLRRLGIRARHFTEPAEAIRRSAGRYVARQGEEAVDATAILVTPESAEESAHIYSLLPGGGPPDDDAASLDPDIRRPDVFFCHPDAPPQVTGPAIAARLVSWLGKSAVPAPELTARVDTERCRACATCVRSCEVGAIEIAVDNGRWHAWVDARRCNACGGCAARCPTNAISLAGGIDRRVENMLEALLQ